MPTLSTPSPDPLLETQVFWVRYKTPILAGLLAIILGVGGYGAYRLYDSRQQDAAANLLAQAKADADYQKVIEQYPGTGAAPSAYLLKAGEERKQQKFAEANATLGRFVEKYPKHQFVATAKMAMAANLESLGKTDEALDAYRRVAAEYPRDFNAPLAMLAQVHLLRDKGQIDQARQVCETVLTQYRESAAANEATQYLRTLKAPVSVALPASTGAGPTAPALNVAPAAASAAPSATAKP